jgi:hypothetical protein
VRVVDITLILIYLSLLVIVLCPKSVYLIKNLLVLYVYAAVNVAKFEGIISSYHVKWNLCHHDTSSGCRWRRWDPDMEGSYKYTE